MKNVQAISMLSIIKYDFWPLDGPIFFQLSLYIPVPCFLKKGICIYISSIAKTGIFLLFNNKIGTMW